MPDLAISILDAIPGLKDSELKRISAAIKAEIRLRDTPEPYGLVTPEMAEVIKAHVAGKDVWDLGAGNLVYSHHLIQRYKAERVVAVDCAPMSKPRRKAIHLVDKPFDQVQMPLAGVDVAFLSYPVNWHNPGLIRLLAQSKVVIYLGSNTGGTACGGIKLFQYLSIRPVLAHVPHHRNSLIVYGAPVDQWHRSLLPEEYAALHPEKMWTFEEAISKSRWAPTP